MVVPPLFVTVNKSLLVLKIPLESLGYNFEEYVCNLAALAPMPSKEDETGQTAVKLILIHSSNRALQW